MKNRKYYVDKSKILEVDEAQKRQFLGFDAKNVYHFWSESRC
ncbi:hypothetical protein [Lutibacter sp. B1]|nr:hypothetical protein [Lutibacter sp. B1]